MDSEPLSLGRWEQVVWQWLDVHPGKPPTLGDVACALDTTLLRLRREHERLARLLDKCLGDDWTSPSPRELLAYSRMSYVARLVAGGVKIDAARALAGYSPNSKSSFNRRFRAFFGMTPQEFRACLEDHPPGGAGIGELPSIR